MTDFELKVYKLAGQIPKGMVTTYGEIARALGNKGLARAVGNALHKNPYEGIVPCHRVVSSGGRMAKNFGFGGPLLQRDMLRKEGVEVVNLTVDLKKYLYIYPGAKAARGVPRANAAFYKVSLNGKVD